MIETRCLPNRSLTAAANSSRLTSFKPTRRRGDLEVAGEGFDFMEFRLSHGDDVNFVFGFRVADRHDGRAKKAGGIKALFAVVIAGVFHREGRPVEYLLGVREIKAVFFQVGSALGGLSREVHRFYYTYDNIYCKRSITMLGPSVGGA